MYSGGDCIKSNILIIIGVAVVAIGVIAAVIVASIIGSAEDDISDDSESELSITVSDNEYSDSDDESSVEGLDSSESSVDIDTSDKDNIDDEPNNGASGIVATANSLIGVPFADNGNDPSGFDNSGFIYYVLHENGYITCPRTTDSQSEMGVRISYSQLKPGDLVFFSGDGSESVSFGGIFIGSGEMIACLMPGQNVKIVDITTDYYRDNFVCGVSLS